MQGLKKIEEYLFEKISKVNVNNPKANTGAVLLRMHVNINSDMCELVNIAFHTIQFHFVSDTSSNPAGTGGLTSISTTIGNKVHRYINREPCPWNTQVRLGDLFVEAFYNCGYIDLYYPKAINTTYVVSATSKWTELADIPALMERVNTQYTHDEPIKGVAIKRDSKVYKDINRTWVRAGNKLQSTGWRINKKVLESLEKNSNMFTSDVEITDNDAKELKRLSKNVEWAFIIAKANKLKDKDKFYQEVDADYRGRLYYKESFLNFQGCDLARGIFQFARAKPMTKEGLWWLAVHTASSYNRSYNIDEIPEWCEGKYKEHLIEENLETISVDKWILEDRVRWTNEHMNTLVEAGETGFIFEEAEKPVALLAACIEWYEYSLALKQNRIHMSHLPVGIDGSNNGWQHLAAMSKDPKTGNLVGLIPCEIQKDFYVQVAKELVNQTTDEYRSSILNEMPMKVIRKGIAKRGAMTRAYSAGASKIAENMFDDCRVNDYHLDYFDFENRKNEKIENGEAKKALEDKYKFKKQLPKSTEDWAAIRLAEEDCEVICLGFARDLIKAINTLCPGPLDIMSYLQKLAKFEIGEYKRFKSDGTPAGKEFTELKKRAKELWVTNEKTEEDLLELNSIIKELKEYKSDLVYGNGSKVIKWTTPSEFPVEYHNFIMRKQKCIGTISGYSVNNKKSQIKHVALIPTTAPDTRGFMCGISPNFVHSMDASHMALVIDGWNGEFGAVHDSFSTHACDIENLLALTKEKFINMYDVDNFYDYIRDQIITNQKDLDIDRPDYGELNISDINNSDYFFA